MGLSEFCDVAWAMLYDDCPAMGDQSKYREALYNLFYLGQESETYDVIGADGRKHTLTRPKRVSVDPHSPLPSGAMTALAEMRAAIVEAGGVVSTADSSEEE